MGSRVRLIAQPTSASCRRPWRFAATSGLRPSDQASKRVLHRRSRHRRADTRDDGSVNFADGHGGAGSLQDFEHRSGDRSRTGGVGEQRARLLATSESFVSPNPIIQCSRRRSEFRFESVRRRSIGLVIEPEGASMNVRALLRPESARALRLMRERLNLLRMCGEFAGELICQSTESLLLRGANRRSSSGCGSGDGADAAPLRSSLRSATSSASRSASKRRPDGRYALRRQRAGDLWRRLLLESGVCGD